MKLLSQPTVRSLYELLSSMRFAVGLLTIIAIASIIGTVLKQNEPYANYAVEFGQYWFQVFDVLGLYDVYHASWFLTILAFLMLSTTLCIVRRGPGLFKAMRSYRDKTSEHALLAIKHSAAFDAEKISIPTITAYLSAQHFTVKVCQQDNDITLIAAKKGTANKLGYFFAHIAIVVIAIGGLIDGNLPLKLAELSGRIVPETRNIPQIQIPAHSRLSADNLSFRGNVTVAEKRSADIVFLNAGQGYLVQELPFTVTLNKFIVHYYSNGMPKIFASEVVVTDKATGQKTSARIQVNHPLIVNGIAIYQASFGDGGSGLRFKTWNLDRPYIPPVDTIGTSLTDQSFKINGQEYTLEFGELRVFNIEDMGNTHHLPRSLGQRLQEAREVRHKKQHKNIGPSITFKLRNHQGQAREFHHYMLPIQQDNANYLIVGTRNTMSEPYQYLRIPLDNQFSIETFMRVRAAIMNPAFYNDIAHRSAKKAVEGQVIRADRRLSFEQSIKWVLTRFAEGGFGALEKFLHDHVPPNKRQTVAQTYIKILQGTIIDVMEVANEKQGLKSIAQDANYHRFLLDSLVTISTLHDYRAPILLQMTGFDQVQASGLQSTRSPGKTLVYLGSLMLVIGILFMFYIRETRLWIRLASKHLTIAATTNRYNDQLDKEFARHLDHIKSLSIE